MLAVESVRPDNPTIAIAGATGYTGSRVAQALARERVGLRLIGRNELRLQRVADAVGGAATRLVEPWDEPGITRALEGCNAVIACAGPFVRAGWPVVRAAVAAGVSYCDSTGEQAFIRRIYDELDGPARDAGSALVPAAGFDYLLGDLGSALAAEGLGPLSAIEVCYAVEHGAMSTGTRRTMIETLGRTSFEYVNGRLRPLRIAAEARRVVAPFGVMRCVSIPGGEAVMVPRHVNVQTVRTFAAAGGTPSSRVLLGMLVALARIGAVRRTIENLFATRGPRPDEVERARFVCFVTARTADGRTSSVQLHDANPYDFTARSLAELAIRLATVQTPAGALTPAQVVEAREFLSTIGVNIRLTR